MRSIAVWGLAYKENTHSIKNSPSMATIAQLKGIKVRAHDPSVSDDAIKHLGIERVGDPLAAARGADGLLILTPWAEYRAIRPEDIAGALSGRIVVDPYSILDPIGMKRSQLTHYTLGRPVGHQNSP